MLKGREQTVSYYSKQDPLSAAEKSNFSLTQDTLRLFEKQKSHQQIKIQTITSKVISSNLSVTKYTPQQLDSLSKVTEKREKLLAYVPAKKITTDSIKLVTDTLSTKYNTYNYPFSEPKAISPAPNNFLLCIQNKVLYSKQPIKKQIKNAMGLVKPKNIITLKPNTVSFLPGKERIESNLDWFTITIVFSLFVFSLIKVTYQKFIVQIVTSIIDYQVAMRLYRERNVLFRNVSFGLHFVFYANIGLFINYLVDYYNLTPLFQNNFVNILFYCTTVLFIYNIKSLTSKILGYIFLVQDNFSQYIHNVNLYNKNIGLFLFPIIIIYPFTLDKFKPFVIYAGLLLLLIMFLLRSYRSAQIIMRKGISLFYLILYLCAVEILPVLLLVKYVSTLI
jgi:hypothetical protein